MTLLTTDRLILRPPAAQDFDGYRAFYMSDRSRFAHGPLSETDAWYAFCVEMAHWPMRGFGMFTVLAQTDPETPIGLVGPWFPADWPEPEIGWLLWDGHEGQGYADEAARACLIHAFGHLGWDTAVSYIHPENAASTKLVERLGAERDPHARAAKPELLVWRHSRTYWVGENAETGGAA
ncbi:GNAT family N-acetyltransferase [Dinoroseobacter sp. S76]|uniref:GNAT family N-acetyltransferase n=1 Tax=Dinoroseobacter sp. S76 TaxID=3415124 RepID=UPI003C7D3CF1